jgi:hypothetical protein
MENRIRAQPLDLFADRVNAQLRRANHVRPYFASIAHVPMHALRGVGLGGTDFERAQCGTTRLRLLKIGAHVRVSMRRVWSALSHTLPLQHLSAKVVANLRAGPTAQSTMKLRIGASWDAGRAEPMDDLIARRSHRRYGPAWNHVHARRTGVLDSAIGILEGSSGLRTWSAAARQTGRESQPSDSAPPARTRSRW